MKIVIDTAKISQHIKAEMLCIPFKMTSVKAYSILHSILEIVYS